MASINNNVVLEARNQAGADLQEMLLSPSPYSRLTQLLNASSQQAQVWQVNNQHSSLWEAPGLASPRALPALTQASTVVYKGVEAGCPAQHSLAFLPNSGILLSSCPTVIPSHPVGGEQLLALQKLEARRLHKHVRVLLHVADGALQSIRGDSKHMGPSVSTEGI